MGRKPWQKNFELIQQADVDAVYSAGEALVKNNGSLLKKTLQQYFPARCPPGN
jgi:hypothetical protein